MINIPCLNPKQGWSGLGSSGGKFLSSFFHFTTTISSKGPHQESSLKGSCWNSDVNKASSQEGTHLRAPGAHQHEVPTPLVLKDTLGPPLTKGGL